MVIRFINEIEWASYPVKLSSWHFLSDQDFSVVKMLVFRKSYSPENRNFLQLLLNDLWFRFDYLKNISVSFYEIFPGKKICWLRKFSGIIRYHFVIVGIIFVLSASKFRLKKFDQNK